MDELSAVEYLVGNEYFINGSEAHTLVQEIHKPAHLPDFNHIVTINIEQYVTDQVFSTHCTVKYNG